MTEKLRFGFKPLHSTTSPVNRQTVDRTTLYERDGQRLRVRIRRDSIDSQSWAVVDLFTSERGWQQIADVHPASMASCRVSPYIPATRRAEMGTAMDLDEAELLQLAHLVLDGDAHYQTTGEGGTNR